MAMVVEVGTRKVRRRNFVTMASLSSDTQLRYPPKCNDVLRRSAPSITCQRRRRRLYRRLLRRVHRESRWTLFKIRHRLRFTLTNGTWITSWTRARNWNSFKRWTLLLWSWRKNRRISNCFIRSFTNCPKTPPRFAPITRPTRGPAHSSLTSLKPFGVEFPTCNNCKRTASYQETKLRPSIRIWRVFCAGKCRRISECSWKSTISKEKYRYERKGRDEGMAALQIFL